MIGILILDAWCNSSHEYDYLGDNTVLAFGGQVFVQVSVFIVLFLLLCDTYPFRIGLLRELLTDFRPVLYCHPVYFIYTMVLGAWRNVLIGDGLTSVMVLWRIRSYASVSVAHKFLATVYYLLNMRATLRLGRPLYYQRDYWVNKHSGNPGGNHRAATAGEGGLHRRRGGGGALV